MWLIHFNAIRRLNFTIHWKIALRVYCFHAVAEDHVALSVLLSFYVACWFIRSSQAYYFGICSIERAQSIKVENQQIYTKKMHAHTAWWVLIVGQRESLFSQFSADYDRVEEEEERTSEPSIPPHTTPHAFSTHNTWIYPLWKQTWN